MIALPSVSALTEWRTFAGHNCDQARAGDPRHAVDGDLEFALDHFIDFFLRMEVFVDGRTALEVVVCEGHARRVKIASGPARQAFYRIEAAGVDERHTISP